MMWKDIQRHVGVEPDGKPGPATAAAIAKALGLHSAAPDIMRTSSDGRALIKQFEGLELKAYLCPAGVLTVGYGHTGPDVKPGMVITEQRADELLTGDLARFEDAVRKLAPVSTACQFSALVSFAYNLGEGALKKSTLLKLHNAGDHAAAAKEFGKWILAGGKPLAGLVKRRAAEAKLYRGAA